MVSESELEKKVPSFLVKGPFHATTLQSCTDVHKFPEAPRAATKELNSNQVYKSRKLKIGTSIDRRRERAEEKKSP